MQPLTKDAASAYRKIDLDARIEASSGEDLTMICLEEAVSALSLAMLVLDRRPGLVLDEPLARAHGIALWLARSVSPENPLKAAMTQFYGGLAAAIARNRRQANRDELSQIRDDFADLLGAAKTA